MAAKNADPAHQTQGERITQLRRWVRDAELDSHPVETMRLRLTTRDASILKRHPEVAVHEVTFTNGEMRFLGVKIEEGLVATSVLEMSAIAVPPA